MPVYSYLCQQCGHEFDQFQHFTDDALTVCPACNEVACARSTPPVGIVFKGKGFYATDNRSPRDKNPVIRAILTAQMAPKQAKRAAKRPHQKIPVKKKNNRQLGGYFFSFFSFIRRTAHPE